MDRNELHQQILELADKIGHLNDTLSRSKKVHPVEIDLLRLYVRELVAGTEELAELAGMRKEMVNIQPETVAAPTITEPVSFEQLTAAAAPLAEKAPPVPEPVVIPMAEPVVEKAPEPFVEKKAEPVVEPVAAAQPAPVVEKAPEPVVEKVPEPVVAKAEPPVEDPKKENPIFEPIVSTTSLSMFDDVVADIPAAVPVAPVTEDSLEPPLRRQVTMQPEAAKPDNSYIKPVTGTAKPVLHTMEEELDAPSINDQFAQQSDLFQNNRRADGKGFKEMMDLGERFLFMKELFGGDSAAFDRATSAIDGIANIDQARAFVEGVLRQKYDWEGKEPIVRQFSNLVEQRFRL
jgi:hypothetical protein